MVTGKFFLFMVDQISNIDGTLEMDFLIALPNAAFYMHLVFCIESMKFTNLIPKVAKE